MPPEQINKEIAEYCGWKFIPSHDVRGKAVPDCWTHELINGLTWYPPDYYNDLNAIHAVEKVLKAELVRQCYIDNLGTLIAGDNYFGDGTYSEMWILTHATSQQRSEAFLKTIGKWRE